MEEEGISGELSFFYLCEAGEERRKLLFPGWP
jgi:hypothetical protein